MLYLVRVLSGVIRSRLCWRCLLLSERAFFIFWIRAMRCPDALRGVVAALCSGKLRQLERLA